MKKFIKYFCLTFLIVAIAALIIRSAISSDKSVFDGYTTTDGAKSAYAEAEELNVSTLELKHLMGSYGYFCAYSMYYTEETGELQVTVRYNKSALEYTGNESHEDIEFLLLKRETPQDLSYDRDDVQSEENAFVLYDGEYFRPDSVETKTRYGLYTYKKLIFKDVALPGDGIAEDELVMVMAPADCETPTPDDDVLLRSEAYESFYDLQVIHYCNQPLDTYKLSGSDIKSLKTEK